MKKLFAAVPALLLAATVHADTGARWYGGLEYGSTELDDNTGPTANQFVSLLGGAVTVTQDSSVGIGRIFLGYRFTEQVALEGGYFKSNKASIRVAGVAGGGGAYTARGDVEFDGFDISGVWFPMANKMGDAGLFLKAGVHHSNTEASFSITGAGGTVSASGDESGTGTLFGIGYDWKFTDQAFARIAATRYLNVGGESDNKGTVYSIAIGTNF